MMDMDESSYDPSCYRCSMGDPCSGYHQTAEEVYGIGGDFVHLPGGYHSSDLTTEAIASTGMTAAEFVAANQDWREIARGWSGL